MPFSLCFQWHSDEDAEQEATSSGEAMEVVETSREGAEAEGGAAQATAGGAHDSPQAHSGAQGSTADRGESSGAQSSTPASGAGGGGTPRVRSQSRKQQSARQRANKRSRDEGGEQ